MSVAEEIKQELHPGKLCINGRWEKAARGGAIELLTTVPDRQGCRKFNS